MGIELEATNDCPPVTVQPRRPKGGDVQIAGTLSQWISGLLLVAPFAEQETRVHITGGRLNEQPYVELTVRMMRQFGLRVEVSDDWLEYRVPAGQQATPHDYVIPPDIGSAAFGIAAAGIRDRLHRPPHVPQSVPHRASWSVPATMRASSSASATRSPNKAWRAASATGSVSLVFYDFEKREKVKMHPAMREKLEPFFEIA